MKAEVKPSETTGKVCKRGKPCILVVTACGRKKHSRPMPAWELYKSSRIRAIRNMVQKYGFAHFAILSAKYGLVDVDQVLSPYEQTMTDQQSKRLFPKISIKLQRYDCVVFFRGGARKEYFNCIREACKRAQTTLIVFGYGIMGGINGLSTILDFIKIGKLPESNPKMCVSLIDNSQTN
jgi:hypothetical protein